MNIDYNTQGKEGKTCGDCKNFEKNNDTQNAGKCFEHEVSANGSCNYFELKAVNQHE